MAATRTTLAQTGVLLARTRKLYEISLSLKTGKAERASRFASFVASEIVPLVEGLGRKVSVALRGGLGAESIESAKAPKEEMEKHLTEIVVFTTKWVGNATRGKKIWKIWSPKVACRCFDDRQ